MLKKMRIYLRKSQNGFAQLVALQLRISMLNTIKGNIQELWNQAHKKIERHSHKYFHKYRGIKNN